MIKNIVCRNILKGQFKVVKLTYNGRKSFVIVCEIILLRQPFISF